MGSFPLDISRAESQSSATRQALSKIRPRASLHPRTCKAISFVSSSSLEVALRICGRMSDTLFPVLRGDDAANVPMRVIAVRICSSSSALESPGRALSLNKLVNVASLEQATREPRARMARFFTAPRESLSNGVRPARPSDWASELARILWKDSVSSGLWSLD